MADKQVHLYISNDANLFGGEFTLAGELTVPFNTPVSSFAESIRQFIRNNRMFNDHTYILELSQSVNTRPYVEEQPRHSRMGIPDMGLTRLNRIGYPYSLRILVPNDIFVEEYAGLTVNDLIVNLANGRGENMQGWQFDQAAPLTVKVKPTRKVGLSEFFAL